MEIRWYVNRAVGSSSSFSHRARTSILEAPDILEEVGRGIGGGCGEEKFWRVAKGDRIDSSP